MSDPISRTQRLLDLIAFLAGRRTPATVDDIMENVPSYDHEAWRDGEDKEKQSLRRKFERDKKELRDAGIPIESVRYTIHGIETDEIEGYRLRPRDFYLPFLRLVEGEPRPASSFSTEVEWTEEELSTALQSLRMAEGIPGFPLRSAARSAFRKLGFGLELEALSHPGALHATPEERAGDTEVVGRLVEACGLRKRVEFTYHSIGRDEITGRALNPYGCFLQHGQWYVVGWCHRRKDVRLFRVSRMTDVGMNKKKRATPDFEIPDDFTLADYTDRDPWDLAGEDTDPVSALVHFDFPRSLWAESNGEGEAVETHEDGSATRRFQVSNADPFVRWVLSMAGEARITDPPELMERQQEMAERVAARHRGGGHG